MARPIVIEFAANTRDFLKKMAGIEDSLDDVADELQDAAKDADKFERDFGDAMKDAERAAEKAARSAGDDFGDLGQDMGDVGREGADEFRQNLAEGLSSGNIEDVVQDTLAGVTSGLSGAAAGVATAVASIGLLVFNEMKAQTERIEALAESAVSALDAAYDVLDQRWTQAKANQVVQQFLEDNKATLLQIAPLLEQLDIDAEEFATQLATGSTEARAIYDHLGDVLVEQEQIAKESGLGAGNWTLTAQNAAAVRDYMGPLLADTERWRREQEFANRAMDDYLSKTGQAAQNWQDTRNWARDALEAVQNMPDRVRVNLEFYATGPGAAYINPNSSSYSPGHVAIGNMYVRNANRAG